MKINIIAAVGKNLELGKNMNLIWHIPEDLKYFKERTMGKTIVMGENTYKSIGKALPNRNNIVLSYKKTKIKDAKVITDYKKILTLKENEIYIIGGEKIYNLFLPYADNLYLTEIDQEDKEADCYFPKFDKTKYRKKIMKKSKEKNIDYKFVIYERKVIANER